MTGEQSDRSDDTVVVRLQIFANPTVDQEEFVQFASQLTEGVREREPGVRTYRWHIDSETGGCLIEEEYVDGDAFRSHMEEFRQSGQMRKLARMIKIERVVILAGEPGMVQSEMARLRPIFYHTVAAL